MKIWPHAKLRWRLTFLPAPANGFEAQVRADLIAPLGITDAGNCQKFVRLECQKYFGTKLNAYWRGSARETGLAFENSKYDVTGKREPRPGDLLYKTRGSGGFGHVGIALGRGFRGENSSAQFVDNDARNIRSEKDFGHYDVLVDPFL